MERTEFLTLAEKVVDGRASEEELYLYNAYLNELHNKSNGVEKDYEISPSEQNLLLLSIEDAIVFKPSSKRFQLSYQIAAAAIVVLTLSVGLYFFYYKNVEVPQKQLLSQVINPGGNIAVLTLSDGKKVALTDKKEKVILTEQDQTMHVNENGELVYDQSSIALSTVTRYHKIETPVGGKYQLVLPDGSKITLNSSSSLKYPIPFGTSEREVELVGEGYFEIAKDASKPFNVRSGQQKVQVLGTQFNINAYPEEGKIATTLIEGSVRVGLNDGKYNYKLKPSQQIVLTGKDFDLKWVDVKEFVAWKDGYFYFNNEHISSAMNKLAKWYNVEIIYQGDFHDIYFNGSFPTSTPLTSVLKILKSTNKLKFKVEGRRIIVMD